MVKSMLPPKTVHQPLAWISLRGRTEVISKPDRRQQPDERHDDQRDVHRRPVDDAHQPLGEGARRREDGSVERGHCTTLSARKRRTL